MHRAQRGDHVSHADERRCPQAAPRQPDATIGAPWVVARSAGEILALAALFLSAVALVVVLDDADAPGSLREQFGLLLIRLAGQANLATAIVLIVALVLAVALALAVRIRDQACSRADQLMLDLGTMSRQVARLEGSLAARDELAADGGARAQGAAHPRRRLRRAASAAGRARATPRRSAR